MKEAHIVCHLERKCIKCKTLLSQRAIDYGKVKSFQELDNILGHSNIPVIKILCPNCNEEEWAEDLTVYNIIDGEYNRAFGVKIGSNQFPVVINEPSPYAVTMSQQEIELYARGLAKVKDCYEEHKDKFWQDYCKIALEKWHTLLKELTVKEFSQAYSKLALPPFSTAAAYRKDAVQRLTDKEVKEKFWRLANEYLVEEEFVWVPIDSWATKEWIQQYGRDRIAYIALNLPLPEELEKWRTIELSKTIKKKTGETGILFERIGQLGRELDKQRTRSQELSNLLFQERQETAQLADQVGKLKQEITKLENRKLTVIRNSDDAKKIQALKGLVNELRSEVDRLQTLIPKETPEKEIPVEQPTLQQPPADRSLLNGKTIAIFGWPNETVETSYKIYWHDGDKVDVDLQALAKNADILIVLTRTIGHQAMWWLKEMAIDMDKPIYFIRERNLNRILDIIADAIRPVE